MRGQATAAAADIEARLPKAADRSGTSDAVAAKTNYFIQYLRGYAAMMVVLDHSMLRLAESQRGLAGLKPFAGDFGAMGVFIFFVISGYLMVDISWNAFGKGDAPLKFWLGRIKRIAPLYYVATILILVVAAQAGRYFTWGETIGSMLFLPVDARPEDGGLVPVLGVGWTLNYEMFFYLLFGLAMFLPRWLGLAASLALLGLLVVMGQTVAGASPHRSAAYFYTHHIMLLFAAGMVLAIWKRTPWFRLFPIWEPATIGAVFCAVVIVALNLGMPGDYPLWRTLLMYAVSCLPVVLAISARPRAEHRGLALLGNASYSIYLFHGFALTLVITVWEQWLGSSLPALRVTVCLVSGAIAGVIAYWWLERPLVDWLKPRSRQAVRDAV